MGFPKVNDWSDEVYHAGTQGGFNILTDLERELHHAIPDLKPYTLGLFVEEDLRNVMPIGWRHMDYGHLDYKTIEDFNKAIGLRYGLIVDVNGRIKVGDNYIMLMPKNYREKVEAERMKALDKQNALANQKAAYVHPSDPNFREMKEAAEETAAKTSSKYKVQVSGEPDHNEE